MNTTDNWLVHDHRKYEAALREVELAAGAGRWEEAERLFREFVEDFKLHMRIEDEVLYPMFRETVADAREDIDSLVEDHDDIVRMLHDLAYVLKHRESEHFEASLAPLYRMMLDHDAYEEEIFSRFGDSTLLARRDEAVARLNRMQPPDNRREWSF
ncbi:hemerythrin domain-containing protein [Thiohalobacter thiocyanaticus]|uniref:Hemerythrin domain-containing protein n=1 Tax=Thiohalobacter thiocyanaticus TaxID=585455 RepID=A0A426QM21_9GAMM|nr:hemerythrin domain-containing protein [Thiohalobacter thiocyanaticus]RRQ22795.1 hemerythrin domain-containing protein [Thiohalobacter thiocyanaticus]